MIADDLGDEKRTGTLNGVGAGLAHRLTGLHVPRNVGHRQVSHGDLCDRDVGLGAVAATYRHAGEHTMVPAAEQVQHASGVGVIDRLPQNLVVDDHHGVGAKDHVVLRHVDGLGLGDRQTADQLFRRLARLHRFVDVCGLDDRVDANGCEKILASRRCRCQDKSRALDEGRFWHDESVCPLQVTTGTRRPHRRKIEKRPRFGHTTSMSLITTSIDGSVATLTLNDPDRRNAMTLDMCAEVEAALDEIEANPAVKALVVTGAGRAFCAGADLTHLGDSAEEGLLAIYEGFLRVGRSPLPTIAAVNGAAVGAGMNLALICDVRLAGESARFDDRFLQIGIHPGGGHTWMFQNIAGPQATAAAVLFSEVLDGKEAERVGLAYRCVPDDQLLAAAAEMAGRTADVPKELVLRTKRSIHDVRAMTSQQGAMLYELGPQAHSTRQPAFKEKIAALKAKVSSKK